MRPDLIDTTICLRSFLDELPPFNGKRPNLYVDLEGNDLCREGTLSLVTIFVESRNTVHLVDVTTLRAEAFLTAGSSGRTLKSILESAEILKVFFDIRNDSDALFSHYDIRVQGIEDIQLMELAARGGSKRLINGLARCIENNGDIGYQTRRDWRLVKEKGQRLFKSGSHGYAIFDRRPLSPEVLDYCVQDVTFLPKLRDSYRAKLCNAAWRRIQSETQARIALSQGSSYNGKGRHMALGPPDWQNWGLTLAERSDRSLLEEENRPGKDKANTGNERQIDPCETGEGATDEGITATAASSAPATESPRRDDGDGVIAAALRELMLRPGSPDVYSDDEMGVYRYGGSGHYSSPSERSFEDLTACDRECGYCGQCMY